MYSTFTVNFVSIRQHAAPQNHVSHHPVWRASRPRSTLSDQCLDIRCMSDPAQHTAISSDIEKGVENTPARRAAYNAESADLHGSSRAATWPVNSRVDRPDMPHRSATADSPKGGLIKRWTTALLTPNKKLSREPTWAQSFNATWRASWLNVLLICIPISWILHFVLDTENPAVKERNSILVRDLQKHASCFSPDRSSSSVFSQSSL